MTDEMEVLHPLCTPGATECRRCGADHGTPRDHIFADIAAECDAQKGTHDFPDCPGWAVRAEYIRQIAWRVRSIESLDRKAGGAT